MYFLKFCFSVFGLSVYFLFARGENVSISILRSIRATIISPKLVAKEHLFATDFNYDLRVSIRKSYKNVTVKRDSLDYRSVFMPLRVDNVEHTLELLVFDSQAERINTNKLEKFCEEIGIWRDDVCKRLIRNSLLFASTVEQQLSESNATSTYKVCLFVRQVHNYSYVNKEAQECLVRAYKGDGPVQGDRHNTKKNIRRIEVERFSIAVADQGTYEFGIVLKASTYERSVILLNSNVHNFIAMDGRMHINSCGMGFIKVTSPSMLSDARIVKHNGAIGIPIIVSCKYMLKSDHNEFVEYQLDEGFACVNIEGQNQTKCERCYNTEETKLFFPINTVRNAHENNLSNNMLRLTFWWSKNGLNVSQRILNECNTIQTRRQVRLWLKDFASKSVAVALEESTPSVSATANINILTGANSGYFKQLKNLVGSIHVWEPSLSIYVYDLGLTTDEKSKILKWRNCHIRSLKNLTTRVPEHVYDVSTYAFKILIIQDMLLQFANVLYIDAGSVLLRPLDIVREQLQRKGYFFLPQTSDAFPWPNKKYHHPNTLKLVGCTDEKIMFIQNKSPTKGCVATVQGWTRNGLITKMVFAPILKCNLQKPCITPNGSDRTNHLQDQTVLNAVLCSKGLDLCSPSALSHNKLFIADRIMVHPISFLDSMYWGHSFRRYDHAAMDFYDAGVVYKI
eukprot:g2950.t1